jgi:ADP-ribose pyrophosphatase YjhB (NUDIX family)
MPIELKAMILIRNDNKILASKGFDKEKQEIFYRLLGGHIEFQESAETAIRREIMEEINSEINKLKLISIIENIFTYQGNPGHEIDYLYKGRLSNTSLYVQNPIPLQEEGEFQTADWIPIQKFISKQFPLYPPFDYKSLFQGKPD